MHIFGITDQEWSMIAAELKFRENTVSGCGDRAYNRIIIEFVFSTCSLQCTTKSL